MADWRRRLIGLGLPCLMAFLLDTSLRLRAQPDSYWGGDYHYILQEGSPFLRALYTLHPLAAIAGYGLWAAILACLLVLLPECLAVILSIAIAFGHIGGAYTWMALAVGTWWYQVANAMFLMTGIALGIGLHWYLTACARRGAKSVGQRRVFLVRWTFIMSLSGLGYFLYLIP
jgi:hypothetical protein